MIGHGVASVKKRERVTIVTCECGEPFDSLESEALARWYLQRHIRSVEKKAAQA